MYVIINNKPSSFLCVENNLRVLDEKKNEFYFHPNKEGKLNFNLPEGKYFVSCRVFRRPVFTPYVSNSIIVPIPIELVKDTKIEFGNNPNKATIFRNERRILIDKKFKKETLWYVPALTFVLFHELSHYVIPDYPNLDMRESTCDKNARGLMYQLGFNPIQITVSAELMLKSGYRKHCLAHSDIGQNFRH